MKYLICLIFISNTLSAMYYTDNSQTSTIQYGKNAPCFYAHTKFKSLIKTCNHSLPFKYVTAAKVAERQECTAQLFAAFFKECTEESEKNKITPS